MLDNDFDKERGEVEEACMEDELKVVKEPPTYSYISGDFSIANTGPFFGVRANSILPDAMAKKITMFSQPANLMTDEMYQFSVIVDGPVHEDTVLSQEVIDKLFYADLIDKVKAWYILTVEGVGLAITLGLLKD